MFSGRIGTKEFQACPLCNFKASDILSIVKKVKQAGHIVGKEDFGVASHPAAFTCRMPAIRLAMNYFTTRGEILMLILSAMFTGASLGGVIGGAAVTLAGATGSAVAVGTSVGTIGGAAIGLAVGVAESGICAKTVRA